MENPFKFGTIVEAEYFTDRVNEVAYIEQFVKSANHLVLISPRRFGKSSLVAKAVKQSGRKHITVNDICLHFSDQGQRIGQTKAHTEQDRMIVVLDEFQEIRDLAPRLDKQLRSIMQEQRHINYILLGSQESMMTDIFENKKSPFYHFGELMRLEKLPREDFHQYLSERLSTCYAKNHAELADRILDYTDCHPYYSQQLAANVWQIGVLQPGTPDPVQRAIDHIVTTHSLDYERLWMNFKRTNKWILQRLASNKPLQYGEYRTSTIYSALKRLQKDGYVIYSNHYEIEDPFFREWIIASND